MLTSKQNVNNLAKQFGIIIGIIICIIIALKFQVYSKKVISIMLLFSVCFFIISFYKPSLLVPLCNIWIKFGTIVSKITQPFFLLVIFIFLFVPLGIFFRIIKKDILGLKFDLKKDTYWHNKENSKENDMKYQF